MVGHWPRSPLGPVSDVMLETPDGERRLLAPTRSLADFVAATYVFDRVDVVGVDVRRAGPAWVVRAGELSLDFSVGARPPVGWLLRAVPPALAGRPWWSSLIDRPAALIMSGVHTTGSAAGGRREFYGARDLHRIVGARASLAGDDLGGLADVHPPVRFGFGSTPRMPALARITSTVQLPGPGAGGQSR